MDGNVSVCGSTARPSTARAALIMEKAVPGTWVPGRFPACMGQLGQLIGRWPCILAAGEQPADIAFKLMFNVGKSNQRAASCPQVHGPELSRTCWQRATPLGLVMPRGLRSVQKVIVSVLKMVAAGLL